MHPIIFETQFFSLHTVWLFFAIAVITGVYFLIKLSLNNGLKLQFLSEHSLRFMLWILIGARIVSIIFHYKTYFYEFSFKTLSQLFFIWDKGLDIWGGLGAFTICLYLLCKKHEQNFWKWLDVIIPAAILGLAIGHIGNFFEGSNYGTPTSLPWGVNFESSSIRYAVPIHPTQIYSALYSIFISSGLMLLSHTEKIKNLSKEGLIALLGAIAYSLFRFLEEFIRGDDAMTILSIRVPHILALIALLTTSTILFLRYNKHQFKSLKKKS